MVLHSVMGQIRPHSASASTTYWPRWLWRISSAIILNITARIFGHLWSFHGSGQSSAPHISPLRGAD
eukprot:7111800-Pyramimonas_sp.AAC.1